MSKNSNRVIIDNLGLELRKILDSYVEDIEEDVVELTDKYTNSAKEELKSISPKSKRKVGVSTGIFQNPGDYAKSWSIKKDKKNKHLYVKAVYNKKYYRLTHLLEFGHAKRNGGRTKPIPHIRKTEDKYREKFERELTLRIRR